MDDAKLMDVLERIATGVEKMGAEPEIEIESGPPLCPSCGNLNPKIRLNDEEGGVGYLGEILIEAVCIDCGNPMYVVIESFSCHRNRQEAADEARERLKGWTSE